MRGQEKTASVAGVRMTLSITNLKSALASFRVFRNQLLVDLWLNVSAGGASFFLDFFGHFFYQEKKYQRSPSDRREISILKINSTSGRK
ncbi:MAG: hypothetical protein PHI36_02995 [Bacteroidales bacterium]|nr:hypothetical protein [Bacteroidales bacterium]